MVSLLLTIGLSLSIIINNHTTMVPRDGNGNYCVHSSELIPHQIGNGDGNDGGDSPDYLAYTNFNRISYFKYLYNYSPANTSSGTCGYVSLIQLMSYYDTFYNDYIIPEAYDDGPLNNTSLSQANSNSPGVVRQAYSNSVYSSYYDFCNSTQNNNLESKLTVIHNTLNNTNNYNSFVAEIGGWDYQALLNSFYGSSNVVTVVEIDNSYNTYTQNQMKGYVKNYIDNGKPVVVHIRSTSGFSRHSVVAYDYSGDTIYANFGYNSSTTHDSLFNSTYSAIYYVAALDYGNLDHYHANNYIIDYECYCGCNQNNPTI